MTFPADFFLFSGLLPGEIRTFSDTAPLPEAFEKGTVIYTTDRFRPAMGIVLKGRVEVVRGHAILNRLGPGEAFGAAALYGEETEYVSEVRAATACEVQFLPQALLDRWMQADHRITENYIRFLSDRIRFLNRRITAFTCGDAERRLLLWLRQHADADGALAPPRRMTELARQLDVGRSSLYRALDALEQSGLIRRTTDTWQLTETERMSNDETH